MRLLASKAQTDLSPKTMQLLIDGDSDTCITARAKDSRTSTVTIRVEFTRQCLTSISAQILMARSSSLYPRVYLRKSCAGKRQLKLCEKANHQAGKTKTFVCPEDSSNTIAMAIQANHSICEIGIYYSQLEGNSLPD